MEIARRTHALIVIPLIAGTSSIISMAERRRTVGSEQSQNVTHNMAKRNRWLRPGRTLMYRGRWLVTFLFCISTTAPAIAYDTSWHKAFGWSGEYPYGFTMTKDVTVNIRENLDPNAPMTISCQLKKGATYHQWNVKRTKSDHLEFVSFTKIAAYEINSTFRTNVTRHTGGRKEILNLKKGDRWFFLTYFGEGMFLFRFDNTDYEGDQDLFEKSAEISQKRNGQRTYEEWLKLNCANGAVGWIFVEEIKNTPGFSEADTTEYGKASDQSEPITRSVGIPPTEKTINEKRSPSVDSGSGVFMNPAR